MRLKKKRFFAEFTLSAQRDSSSRPGLRMTTSEGLRMTGKPGPLFALALTAVLFSLLPVLAAQATPILVNFTANFHPPDPCASTSLGDLTGTTMEGAFALFYRIGRAGDLVQTQPGPPEVRGVACGASGGTGFTFDLDLTSGATLYLSFTGALVQTSPGPPDMPVYAFAPETSGPTLPDGAPLIELGVISLESSPGPPGMPLFAFASPGHDVGNVAVTIAVVPEPSTLLLLSTGLLGAAGYGVRRLRKIVGRR